MPGRLTHTAALALAALTCAIGTAACGGESEDEAADRQAQARWEEGVPRWSADMIQTLNEISLLLASAPSVNLLQGGDAEAMAHLRRLERSLARCSATIRALGRAPEKLITVRREAFRACRNLENGGRLVGEGVAAWQAGTRSSAIDDANVALGNGQQAVERARRALGAAVDD
jgi:hypothetical protein